MMNMSWQPPKETPTFRAFLHMDGRAWLAWATGNVAFIATLPAFIATGHFAAIPLLVVAGLAAHSVAHRRWRRMVSRRGS